MYWPHPRDVEGIDDSDFKLVDQNHTHSKTVTAHGDQRKVYKLDRKLNLLIVTSGDLILPLRWWEICRDWSTPFILTIDNVSVYTKATDWFVVLHGAFEYVCLQDNTN